MATPDPDPNQVKALVAAFDTDTLRAMTDAAEAHAATLRYVDTSHPNPDIRKDAARITAAAAVFKSATSVSVFQS